VRPLPIGLDIGTTTVRLLQLAGTERDLRVVDAAKFVIPQDVKVLPERRREVVTGGIRRLLKEHNFRGREVVMALAPGQLAIRNVRLPKMPDEERTTAVNWEAQNRFPFDTATAVIQHLPAGEVRQGAQLLDEIMILAAPQAEVDAQIQWACEAGLEVVSLDAEPCAVFRGFERFLRRREDEGVVSVLVDIGAQATVVIARGREVVFVKMIPIGGMVFNRAVAECLDLAVTEAEGLRRRLGRRSRPSPTGAPPDEETQRVCRAVADAIRPHLEDLAGEIALCLRYYSVTFRGPRPESVTFTGGESHNHGIPRSLGERLGVEFKPGDLFRGVKMDHVGRVLDRSGELAEWTTAFGLSLKGFHLAAQLAAGTV
jgi:type IV pilus assembly protein PilM